MNPGRGSKALTGFGNAIHEARSAGGARVYFRHVGGATEIVGYSNKKLQSQVIDRLRTLYGN